MREASPHRLLQQYWRTCFLFSHFHVKFNMMMVSIFREQFSELLFRSESSVNKDAFSLASAIFSTALDFVLALMTSQS